MSAHQTTTEAVVGYRLARIDEDFYLDRYAEDASSKDYTTTIYQVPSIQTEDEIIGLSDNKGYLKLFNIQQNEYAIYKLFVESEGGVIPLNTSWRQFKFISNNQLSTPRTYKSRILFENEEDEPPCYHGCPGYKICFLQQNSNKVFYSVVHFGKAYYENDSLYARSTNVFGCAQHQDQITCFDIENNYLVTGSINGDIKVWIHKEESIELNQDESFELAWSLKGIHKKQLLQNVSIIIPTSGYSKNPFIVSGGGSDGIILIHDIENQQLLQQIILESSPLSLMKEFMPSSSLIACNQLGTVYLYEESEDIHSNAILNLQIVYYIISDQPNITVNSVTCFFMNNDMVNVFSVTFKDRNNNVISNSIQFYIGQLLVMEYSFETPVLFCTVFSMKRDTRINVKSSIPLPGSHLVACDKDGRGHVWLIDEIISQIIKRDQQDTLYEDPDLPEEPSHNTSFSLETPRPHTIAKQMEAHHSPEFDSEDQPIIDYSSDEDLLTDVTSLRSSLSSISLPREVKYVPKPTMNPSSGDLNPTIPQTMDQMLWSQEFTSDKSISNDHINDMDAIDRNRDISTPEPQVINIRKTKLPTKQSSPILKTHSLPEIYEPSPIIDDEELDEESIPKPIIIREKSPLKETSLSSAPTPTTDSTLQSPSSESKPVRRRTKPEITKARTPSNIQDDNFPKKPISNSGKSTTPTSLKKSSSSNQVKIVNHLVSEPIPNVEPVTNAEEPEDTIPIHSPAITPNSSRRIEYKLYQKQNEHFNEEAARQALKENSLFPKNEAEKVLNYTPGESMFGNLTTPDKVDDKNYDIVETKVRKQVSKKHLEEMKQRPSIMDLYVREEWEKEVTLEQTGPRIIYSLSFDQFEDVIPHPKAEYDSIRKFLKENPII